MGDATGIDNGLKRGYDRIVAAPYITLPTYEGVKRTIDHLDAFAECDNYVFLHVSDSHPVVSYAIPPQPKTQAKLPWQERVYEGVPRERAFDLNGKRRNVYDNVAAIERMDRALGELFRYIEDHYKDHQCLFRPRGFRSQQRSVLLQRRALRHGIHDARCGHSRHRHDG